MPKSFEKPTDGVALHRRPLAPFGVVEFAKQHLGHGELEVVIERQFKETREEVFEIVDASPGRHRFLGITVEIARLQGSQRVRCTTLVLFRRHAVAIAF